MPPRWRDALRDRLDDEIADDTTTSNSPAIQGDGIRLGLQADAELVGMGFIQMLPTCDPKTGELFTGLQVPPANFVMACTRLLLSPVVIRNPVSPSSRSPLR